MSSKLLLTPGPTNIPEEYLEILGSDIIHHRTPEFRRIMKENNENLKKVFKTTQNDVAVLTSSGTGSMETAIVNFFSKGDKVLAVNTGYFGDRFRKIAEIYGLNVINLQYEFGESYKLEDVKKVISENPDLKGILATHSETSVGILNDIKSLGDLTKNTEILLVVDTISGLVVNEFNFDEWHVDVAIAGSQKAFLIPPGLAFVAISDKAKKAMETSDLPKYYFDLKQYVKYFEEKGETPYTPAIALILALNQSLKDLVKNGIENTIKQKHDLRKYVEEKAEKLGFKLLVKNEENRTNTLISVYREGIIIKSIIDALEEKGYTVTGGKGKYAESLMRIGILGQISKEQIDDFFVIFEEELKGYDYWGFCDTDVLLGDIYQFLEEHSFFENDYVRYGLLGHLQIFKNSQEVNRIFMSGKDLNYRLNYKNVFTSEQNFIFDEEKGIQILFEKSGFEQLQDKFFDDIDISHFSFREYGEDEPKRYYSWSQKHGLKSINLIDGQLVIKHPLYAHFQKRTIECPEFEPIESFYVIPNKLVFGEELSIQEIEEVTKNKFYWTYWKRILRSKLNIEKYSIGFIRHKLRMKK